MRCIPSFERHQALARVIREDESKFRQVVVTSDEFNSTLGTFQVYILEGTGKELRTGIGSF